MKIFITGTDTGIGKTRISVALLERLSQKGYKTLGIKPLATGGKLQNNILYHDDALALRKVSSVKLAYQNHNPITFKPAIAPHLAAKQINQELSVQNLITANAYALHYPTDITLVEGVGGWFVPLNLKETMADFVVQCGLSVILVVGIRLGCLNHALLTAHALQQADIKNLGWIANCITNDPLADNMIATLKSLLPLVYLGCVPWNSNALVPLTL